MERDEGGLSGKAEGLQGDDGRGLQGIAGDCKGLQGPSKGGSWLVVSGSGSGTVG